MENKTLHRFVQKVMEEKFDEWSNQDGWEIELNDVPERIGDVLLQSEYNQNGLHLYGCAYWLEDEDRLDDVLRDTLAKVVNKPVVDYAVNYSDFQDGFVYITIITKD